MRQVCGAFVVAIVLAVLGPSELALAQVEICGDGIDNTGSGLADEGCYPTGVTGVCESPLSCARAGAVSPIKGQLVFPESPDISVRVPYGPPLELRRTYFSQYEPGYQTPTTYRAPLGLGWQHNYMSWLEKYSGTPDTVVLHTTSGQDVHFTFDHSPDAVRWR